MPDARLEEVDRVVVGLGLRVLAEGEADRAAVGRVGHHPKRAGQGGQDMLGPADPVEVAHDGAEAVVGRHGRVVEILDLLQHRVGRAVGEDVAGDEEDRQAVHMRHGGGGDHVGRPRPDRGGDGHRLPPMLRLGIGDGGMGHGLFVLAAPGGQGVLVGVQRLTQAGDVAVAEDRPDAFDEAAAILGLLHGQPADHGLRGGKADRGHFFPPSRAWSQRAARRA